MAKQIIVITGPSGCGKTTIGKIIENRYKNVSVIDTDDIDDSTFDELYHHDKKYKKLLENPTNKMLANPQIFIQNLIILNETKLLNIVNKIQ